MKTFQVTQNFGDSCFSYIYFDMPYSATIDEIESKAIEVQRIDFNNRFSGFTGKQKEKPTIKISEYYKGKKVKDGVKFSTKWR